MFLTQYNIENVNCLIGNHTAFPFFFRYYFTPFFKKKISGGSQEKQNSLSDNYEVCFTCDGTV